MATTKTKDEIIPSVYIQTYFQDRALFYASHAIRKQAPRKKYWNYELKAVYVIAILDFITFTEETAKGEVIERVCLYREKAGKRYSDKLNLVFIELPKFNKTVNELENNTETWLYLLKNTFELNGCPPEITGKVFKRFLEMAEIKHLTPIEMETYAKSLKRNPYLRDMANCERMEGRMEGHMEGRMEGRMEGHMEGRMEGEKKGRMEERMQFAIKLLQRNTPVEDVISLTSLTEEQVQKLLLK